VRSEALVFVALALGAAYCSTQGIESSPAPQDAREWPHEMGDAMRQRNERAKLECVGTVEHKRQCWLQLKVESAK
jgi:hypothetical protein